MHGEERRHYRPTFAPPSDAAQRPMIEAGGALALTLLLALLSIASPARADESAASMGDPMSPHAVSRDSEESLTLFAGTDPIVLGEAEEVTLHVRSTVTEAESPLRGSVNVGVLGEVVALEPGLFRIEYSLPEARFPQVAVIALWRETGPDAAVSFFRVPLPGSARVPVQTRPGTNVTVTVDGRPFGPFRAGSDGRVEARLVVPPGVAFATVSAEGTNRRGTTQGVALEAPPYNRMTVAAVPSMLAADGVSSVRVHVYYDAPGPRPPVARLSLRASRGDLGTLAHRFGPLYEAEFKALPGTVEGELRFEASMRGDGASTGAAAIRVVRQRPTGLDVARSRPEVVADGSAHVDFAITARDRLGLGVPGLEVGFDISPEEALRSADLIELGSGEYRLRIVPKRLDPPGAPVELRVRLFADEVDALETVVLNPWAPAELRVHPERFRLPADGRAVAVVMIRAHDSTGRPLDHLLPEARASAGRVVAIEAVESMGYRIRYESPALEYSVPPRGRASPPVREETLEFAVGGVDAKAVAILTAGIERPWVARGFLEISGGYRTNQRHLAGPQAAMHAGAYLVSHPRLLLGGGVWAGASDQQGAWETFGAEAERVRVRLLTIPLMASASAVLPLGSWSFGLGGGVGLMATTGTLGLESGEEVPIDGLVHAMGARLFLGRRLGAGRLTLGVSYLHAMQQRRTGQVDVTGQLGGPGATIGYRLEK